MRKYLMAVRGGLLDAFAYRGQIVARLLFYVLFLYVFFCLWTAIYKGGEVAGYSLTQMVWYLCFTELIMFGCRSQVFDQMNTDVKSGAIAYQLGRPYHYVFFQCATALGGTLWQLLCFGSLATVVGLVLVGPLPGFLSASLPFALISLALGVTLQFFVNACFGLSAFYIEDSTAISFLYNKLVFMLGGFIPVEFLPDWLQRIARSLPFSYVAWGPSRLLVSFDWDLCKSILPMQLLWVFCFLILCLWMYRGGTKKINAHGG